MSKSKEVVKKEEVVSSKEDNKMNSILMAKIEALEKKLEETTNKFSKEEQAAIEAARDEMITNEDEGPCYIDPKYKEEGYTYRIVDTTRPGRLQRMMKYGYEIVYDETVKVGSNTVQNTGSLTGAVSLNLGGEMRDRQGVLMRTPTDHYNKRQKVKDRINNEAVDAALNQASEGASFGEITIGNKTHFKQ